MSKMRLDKHLVALGLIKSRHKAQSHIKNGQIKVNGKQSTKVSALVDETDEIEIVEQEKYVGRGGIKLEEAIRHFKIKAEGKRCLDIGASTGGFTDCLLQHGAKEVVALDVGHGQMVHELKEDPRVQVLEGVNARYLKPGSLQGTFEIITIDVSFISLRLILPSVAQFANSTCQILALIKPQFEVGAAHVGEGGIVLDEKIRKKAVEEIRVFVIEELGWLEDSKGVIASPILGANGNKEFLLCAKKSEK